MKVHFSLRDELIYIGSKLPNEIKYESPVGNKKLSIAEGLCVDDAGMIIRLALDESGWLNWPENSSERLFCAGVCFEEVLPRPVCWKVGESVDLIPFDIDNTRKEGRVVWSVEHGIKVDNSFMNIMDMSKGYYGLFEVQKKVVNLCVSMVVVESDMACLLLVNC